MAGIILINKDGKIWIEDYEKDLKDFHIDNNTTYEKKLNANGVTIYVELNQDKSVDKD